MTGWAQWGWLGVAINVVFVLANLVCLVLLDGGWLNWLALVACTASGVYAYQAWREEVDAHRRWIS